MKFTLQEKLRTRTGRGKKIKLKHSGEVKTSNEKFLFMKEWETQIVQKAKKDFLILSLRNSS